MKHLLFCWELGANFGHISNVAALLPELTARGFQCEFAVIDLKVARELLGPGPIIHQAPVWPRHNHNGSTVGLANFSDVLALVGFGAPGHLQVVVEAWLSLFALIEPRIVIADHSPAAQIAARLSHRRLLTVGSGFTLPPLDLPEFPPLRADVAQALPDDHLLAVVNDVRRAHGQSPGATLTEMFQSDGRVIIGLPELDPYRSFRREPLHAPVGGFVVPGEQMTTPRLFVYLGAEMPDLTEKVQVLCELPMAVEFYIRGADPLLLEFIRLRGKTVNERPASIKEVLSRSTHVVSQAGAMLSSEALAAGRPQLLLPLHEEARRNAAIIAGAGLGQDMRVSGQSVDSFRSTVKAFIQDKDLADRTLNFARVIAKRNLPASDRELLRLISELMA